MNSIEPILLKELKETDYESLINYRIRKILMICSNYDAFILEEDGQILAYLRIFHRSGEENTAQIGRVISAVRRKGYGSEILKAALGYAKDIMHCSEAYLEAQCYASGLYEKQGFHIVSEPFLEDGIPHVRMRRHL
jgi:predicted GNAT family N-acyltransferase